MKNWAALPRWPNGYQRLKWAFCNVVLTKLSKNEKFGQRFRGDPMEAFCNVVIYHFLYFKIGVTWKLSNFVKLYLFYLVSSVTWPVDGLTTLNVKNFRSRSRCDWAACVCVCTWLGSYTQWHTHTQKVVACKRVVVPHTQKLSRNQTTHQLISLNSFEINFLGFLFQPSPYLKT